MSTDVKGSSEAEQGPGWWGGAATGHKARLNPPTQVRGSVPGFKGTALAAVGGGEGARCEDGEVGGGSITAPPPGSCQLPGRASFCHIT